MLFYEIKKRTFLTIRNHIFGVKKYTSKLQNKCTMLKSMGGGHFQNVGLNLATIVVFGPYFGNATTLGLCPTHMQLPIYGPYLY